MAGAIGVRGDYSGADLRMIARRSGAGEQVRRLLALASMLDEGSRSIMSIGLRQWAHGF